MRLIMKFNEYLKLLGKTPHAYAKEHGLSIATTWRAATGRTTPALDFVLAIQKESRGMVKPEDWLEGRDAA